MKASFPIGLVLALLLAGCDKDCSLETDVPVTEKKEYISPATQARRGQVIDWKYNGSLTAKDVSKQFGGISASYLKHNLKCYKLVYSTLFKDQLVDASALVLIPDGMKKADILAFFHGTAVPSDVLVPDFYQYCGGSISRLQLSHASLPMASNGFITVVPDYVGYGTTYGYEHSFIYYPELSKGNIDAIIAAKALAEELGLEPTESVFLTGWSQGAGAALAAHKYIEESYSDRFAVAASSSLSGPYDFKGFVDYLLERPNHTYAVLNLYCWALYNLNHFSPYLGRPDDQIFRKPLYDQNSVFYGVLGTTVNDLFRDSFLKGYKDGTDKALITAMEENSYHTGWDPKGKVFLHHGEDDTIVPFLNTLNAYEGLKSRGDVTMYSYPGKGHLNLFKEYVSRTLDDFASLKTTE